MSTPTPVALSLFPRPLDLIAPHERDRILDHLATDPWHGQLTPATCPNRREGIAAFLRAARCRGGSLALAAKVDVGLGLTPESVGRPRHSRRIWWPPYDSFVDVPYSYNRVRALLSGKTRRTSAVLAKAIAEALGVPIAAVLKHCEWIAKVPRAPHSKHNRPRPLAKKVLGQGPNGGRIAISGRRVGR